jgi:predicted metal-dependent RNase
MKKSVYSYSSHAGNPDYNVSIEILLDINRELTDKDNINLMKCVDELANGLRSETANNDPEIRKDAEKQKQEILNLFADGSKVFVKEVPNEYCNCHICKHMPWFIITTNKGNIKIGWRKRVLCINWDQSGISKTAEELFSEEQTTKFDKTIHAWGYEKAKEYLEKILA